VTPVDPTTVIGVVVGQMRTTVFSERTKTVLEEKIRASTVIRAR